LAHEVFLEAIGEKRKVFAVGQQAAASSDDQALTDKNPHAVALGKLGGSKGGAKRAANLTPERRAEIAKKAAAARWGKLTS
jgi:hypothetical protein